MKRVILPLLFLFSTVFAVVNTFEQPKSVSLNLGFDISLEVLRSVDSGALLQEDIANSGPAIPMRYAESIDVDFDISSSGIWETLEDGSSIWRLGIKSPNAFGMKFLFDTYILPEGGELIIFNKAMDMSIGPYKSEQNHSDLTFGTPLVKGDEIIIEYFQPSWVEIPPQLHLKNVFHAYRDIHNFYESRDRSCGDNVACSSANPYEDQVNSVIYLEMYQYICSAALINNTEQDLTPYVLTAWHCVESETNVGSHNNFTFYFDHQSSSCSGTNSYYGHSQTGSYTRAWGNMSTSDFALLEMDNAPSSWWNSYYAGWSRSSSNPSISVGIHHPGGDPKKINFDNGDTATDEGWNSWNTHWGLYWDNGGTAGGSSGSPLFNTSNLIVGQLSGGTGGDCGSGQDLYGKISKSWNNGSSSSTRLKDWLDPSNSSVYSLDGTYDGVVIVYGCTNSNACNYDPDATNDDGSCEYAQTNFDCDGNCTAGFDCSGVCGGNAINDACGICDGPGAVYECGCSDIPYGDCDCNGNELDECGVCGGNGTSCASIEISFGDYQDGSVEIIMNNTIPVGGFQFEIVDTPDIIDLGSNLFGGTASYNGFNFASSPEGMVLGFSFTGNTIPAGNAVLINIPIEGQGSTQLCFTEPIITDWDGTIIDVQFGDCINLDNGLLGDLTSDGLINVTDIVVLLNIILGYNEATPAQQFAGDLNSDGILNVIDVVLLVNIILS